MVIKGKRKQVFIIERIRSWSRFALNGFLLREVMEIQA